MESNELKRLGFGPEVERWVHEEAASAPEDSSSDSDSARHGAGGGGRGGSDAVARRRRRRPAWTRLEEAILAKQHSVRGNAWSAIAAHLPGRSASEVKNIWHSTLRSKKLKSRSLLRAYARGVHERGESTAARLEAFRAAVKLARGCDPSFSADLNGEPIMGRQPDHPMGDDSEMQADMLEAAEQEDAVLDGGNAAAEGAELRGNEFQHTGSSEGMSAPCPTSHPSSPGHSLPHATDHVGLDSGADPQNRDRTGEGAGDGLADGDLRKHSQTLGTRDSAGATRNKHLKRGSRQPSVPPSRGKEGEPAAGELAEAANGDGSAVAAPPLRPRSLRQAAAAARGVVPSWQRPWVEEDVGGLPRPRQQQQHDSQQQQQQRPRHRQQQRPEEQLEEPDLQREYSGDGGKGLPWVGALQAYEPHEAGVLDDPRQLQPPMPRKHLQKQHAQKQAGPLEDDEEEDREDEDAEGEDEEEGEELDRDPATGLGPLAAAPRFPLPVSLLQRRRQERELQEAARRFVKKRPNAPRPQGEELEADTAAAAAAAASVGGAAGANGGDGGKGAWRQEKGGRAGAGTKLEKQLAELAPGINWGAAAHHEARGGAAHREARGAAATPPELGPVQAWAAVRATTRNHAGTRAAQKHVDSAAAAAAHAAAAAAAATAAAQQKMLSVPLSSVGPLGNVGSLGSLGNVGSLGSLGNVGSLGSLGNVASLGPLAAALIAASSVGGGSAASAAASLGPLATGLPAGALGLEGLEQLSAFLARVKMERLISEHAAMEAAAIWQVAQATGLAGLASLPGIGPPGSLLGRNWDARAQWPLGQDDGPASGPSNSDTGTKANLPPHRNAPREDPAQYDRLDAPSRPSTSNRAGGYKRQRSDAPLDAAPPPLPADAAAWAGLPPPNHQLALAAAARNVMAQSLLFGGGGMMPGLPPAAASAAAAAAAAATAAGGGEWQDEDFSADLVAAGAGAAVATSQRSGLPRDGAAAVGPSSTRDSAGAGGPNMDMDRDWDAAPAPHGGPRSRRPDAAALPRGGSGTSHTASGPDTNSGAAGGGSGAGSSRGGGQGRGEPQRQPSLQKQLQQQQKVQGTEELDLEHSVGDAARALLAFSQQHRF